MIKGITFIRPVHSPAQFDELVSFFSALGFEPGRGWDEPPRQPGAASRGRPFLAPLGNLEFVDGALPTLNTDLLIEVTALDAVHQIARQWLETKAGAEAAKTRITAIEDTHWKSRLFTAEPVPGFSAAFWEWQDPLHGKTIALAGDLSAADMSFAIVVARWNAVITERLLQGALDALLRSGAKRDHIEVAHVPGSWEIPAAARQLAERADSTPSSPSAASSAARPRTTKPSTTRSPAASASPSRKPASRTPSASSPAKRWSRPSTAPA
jgi:6,7-dimethyl-8-ribityllumazine synthase